MRSARLRLDARTLIRTSLGFGSGVGSSRTSAPFSPTTAAFMMLPPLSLLPPVLSSRGVEFNWQRRGGMEFGPLATTSVGSFPRPTWLAQTARNEVAFRMTGDALGEAFDDATVVCLREQE